MPFVALAPNKLLPLRVRFSLLAVLAGLLLPWVARAQVSFDGVQVTLASFSSSYSLSPIAVDGKGDTFFVVTDGTTNTLYEAPANGALTALNSSFPFLPEAIAVNTGGTVLYFIYFGTTANCSGGYVFLATAPVSAGTTPSNMPCSFPFPGYGSTYTVTYSDPTGLAVDPRGNLWIADYGAAAFFEITGPVGSSSVPTNYAALAVGQPYDIAVNGNGTVYFTMLNYPGGVEVQEVASIPASAFSDSISGNPATATAIVTNVPSIQSGLAVDGSGNLYLGGGSSADSEVSGSSLAPVDSDFVNGTDGLATDSNGELFIDGADGTGTQYVVELNKKAANFGSQAVGGTSGALSLNFTITNTTVGSIGVLTLGAANLDFANAVGSSCAAQDYTTATNCVVNVTFTPAFAGPRMGAVVLYSGANNTGTVLAMVPLYGIGTGPQIAYGPGTATVLTPAVGGVAIASPVGEAVDAAGDLFIADSGNNRVVEVPAGGGAPIAISPTVSSEGLSSPEGVALDGAGDLYIADDNNNRVVEVPTGGGPAIAISPTVDSKGFSNPLGLAVDGAGDLFVADILNNRVVEIPSGGGAPTAIDPTVNSLGLSGPIGVAVDGAGDLFIADTFNNRVVEVPAGGGTATAIDPTVNSVGLNAPVGVTLDAAGDLFIADEYNNRVVEVPAGGGAPIAIDPTVNTTGLYLAGATAFDAMGDMFIADYGHSRVVELERSKAPLLNFPTVTPVGSTDTTDGTQTVQIQNIGNENLTLSALSYPPDFPEAGGDANACTSSTSLSAGQECDLPIEFAPVQGGLLSEDVTLTDNALNASSARQSIVVSGTADTAMALLTSPAPGSTLLGPSVTFSWTAATGAPTGYYLRLGSTGVGSGNLWASGVRTGTSANAVGLPTNGETIYARLITYHGSVTTHVDYTYTAATQAALTGPSPGSTLAGPKVAFTWTAAAGATGYYLRLGSGAVGAGNLWASGALTGTSVTAVGLPTNGETIHARLFTYYGGVQTYADYIYTAATQAALASPAPGSTLAGPSVTFSWTTAAGATGYSLYLGSTGVGSANLYESALTTSTSIPVINLPVNGETIYARLTTSYNGVLSHADYTYTAATQAAMTSPAPGSTLAGSKVTFTWSAAAPGATGYSLLLGSTGVGSYNLFTAIGTTATSVTPSISLPVNGETIYARLYTNFSGVQTHADYAYTAATQAVMTSPAPGSTLAGPSVTFTWTTIPGATGYSLYLGSTGVGSANLYESALTTATSIPIINLPVNGETIYARLTTSYGGVLSHADYTYTAATQAALTTPAPGSTLAGPSVTFSWTAATGTATGYSLYLGSTGVGSFNLYESALTTATSLPIINLPVNGETIYARLTTSYGGVLSHADYTYTAATQAALTTPAPGSTLPGPSVTFSWTAATGTATGYSLWLGSTGVGSYNLFTVIGTTATSVTPSVSLPVNGETIYARLYTNFNGVQTHADYTYTAAP